jgi:predicted secreted protein
MITHATNSSSRPRHAVAATFALAASLFALPVLAAPASPPPPDDGLTVLHLSEAADRAIRRDRLRVQLRVEATAANAKQVQAEINRRMASALTKVKAVAGIKPETGSYSVYEERQQNVPSRWRGVQSLSLLDHDFAELLTLVGDLQNDGLAVSALAFELSPEAARAAQDELTNEALNRLRERAERIAMELHLSFQRYRDVRVGNVGGERPVPLRAMAMAADAKQAAPPVGEAGDAMVQVSVDADVVLGPDESKGP